MTYTISAVVMAVVNAVNEEKALDKFEEECPYNVIESGVCCKEEKKEEETDPFRKKYGFDF